VLFIDLCEREINPIDEHPVLLAAREVVSRVFEALPCEVVEPRQVVELRRELVLNPAKEFPILLIASQRGLGVPERVNGPLMVATIDLYPGETLPALAERPAITSGRRRPDLREQPSQRTLTRVDLVLSVQVDRSIERSSMTIAQHADGIL
jgi:hypothetical protein